jgi:hypothetical protein
VRGLVLAHEPITSARTLGPALVAGQFNALWAYIVGPLIGGIAAALLSASWPGETPRQGVLPGRLCCPAACTARGQGVWGG